MMVSLFSEESIQEAYGKEKYDEGVAYGEARGEARGEAKGKDAQAKITVLNLHAAGMDSGMIAKMVGYGKNIVETWIAGGVLA